MQTQFKTWIQSIDWLKFKYGVFIHMLNSVHTLGHVSSTLLFFSNIWAGWQWIFISRFFTAFGYSSWCPWIPNKHVSPFKKFLHKILTIFTCFFPKTVINFTILDLRFLTLWDMQINLICSRFTTVFVVIFEISLGFSFKTVGIWCNDGALLSKLKIYKNRIKTCPPKNITGQIYQLVLFMVLLLLFLFYHEIDNFKTRELFEVFYGNIYP